MTLCLHPSYFPNIHTFSLISNFDVLWEVHDNFQKQTYRNRCYIATDTGAHMLTIPIKHSGKQGRQLYKEVRIDNSYPWQRDHWRGLATAYRASPYFEYFEDDLYPLYHKKFDYLLDFNFKTIKIICDLAGLKMPLDTTTSYSKQGNDCIDKRTLVESKKWYPQTVPSYIQVFSDRNGFLPDLSVLDLLFNEGNNTALYLKKYAQSLDIG